MAKSHKVQQITLDDGRVGWEYSDGAIRDVNGRAMVLPDAMAKHAITSDNARDMVRLREEKRMRLYNEGALRAVERVDLLKEYGPDAHLVERAMILQQIATTPEAGKAAVMADTALQRAQGYETQRNKQDSDASGAGIVRDGIAQGVAQAMERVMRDVMAQQRDTIEGTIE